MTDSVIIDGIDVSECKYLPYCEDKQGNCGNNPDCYFKQLKRKEQECERYKKALNEIEQHCNEQNLKYDTTACEILDIINKAKDDKNDTM